jgi:hypothetical protein
VCWYEDEKHTQPSFVTFFQLPDKITPSEKGKKSQEMMKS